MSPLWLAAPSVGLLGLLLLAWQVARVAGAAQDLGRSRRRLARLESAIGGLHQGHRRLSTLSTRLEQR